MKPSLYPPRREFAPGIYWLGGCAARANTETSVYHSQASAFLCVGSEKSVLYDTGAPGFWRRISSDLDEILGDRPLDLVVPSHPELPHSGNVGRLLTKYPDAKAIGDVRDYHIFYPEHAARFEMFPLDKPIPLGGGMEFVIVEAPIKDLVQTVFGYESQSQTLFVADAMGYKHHAAIDPLTDELQDEEEDDEDDEPLHKPGECRLLNSEMPELPELQSVSAVTAGGLSWTGFMDAGEVLETMKSMLDQYPANFIAPTHGNVIDDLDAIFPLMKEAYTLVYKKESAKASA